MKGVSSDTAAAAIETACRMKWEQKASDDLSEPNKTSEVESTQQISSDPPERMRLDNRSNNNESPDVEESISPLSSNNTEPTNEKSGTDSNSSHSTNAPVAKPEEIDRSVRSRISVGFCSTKDRLWHPSRSENSAYRLPKTNKHVIGCKSQPLTNEGLCATYDRKEFGGKSKFVRVKYSNSEEQAGVLGYWKVHEAKGNAPAHLFCDMFKTN